MNVTTHVSQHTLGSLAAHKVLLYTAAATFQCLSSGLFNENRHYIQYILPSEPTRSMMSMLYFEGIVL